jgi:uncharacterized protein YndB with AHSA1/START domain
MEASKHVRCTRRSFLRLSSGAAVGLLVAAGVRPIPVGADGPASSRDGSAAAGGPSAPSAPGNRVTEENHRSGTTAWQLYAGESFIWGYADRTSVNRGDALRLCISTSQPTYEVEVYRIGWYGGTGGRLIAAFRDLQGYHQPVPTPTDDTGLIAADWEASVTVATGEDWVSGVYLAKLVARGGSMSYITFVVRDDAKPADLLYVQPVSTYQAYNNWGGNSLYDFNSTDGRAYEVSFDRPYAGDGAGQLLSAEINMVRWIESQGYDVTYATSVDLHATPDLFQGRKVFVSSYHDEYWSRPMRHNVTTARDTGVHLAFFGSNAVYWQVRFRPAADGTPDRVLVCYKDAERDPLSISQPNLATVLWRDRPVSEPENALLGIMWESYWDDLNTSFPWVVKNAEHWIYQGTGLKDDDLIPGLVGYEYDRVYDNGRTPVGLTVLSASPVVDTRGKRGISNSTIYTAPSGAMVFATGTNFWSRKLDDQEDPYRGANTRVKRMTANLLAAMGCHPETPAGVPAVRLVRYLPAPPEVVFEAWTSPESLVEWLRPGSELELVAELDVRVGGAFRLVARNARAENVQSGEYREIDRPHRLVFTWGSAGTRGVPNLVTLRLRSVGAARTELTLVHELLPDNETATRQRDFWERALDRLDHYVG